MFAAQHRGCLCFHADVYSACIVSVFHHGVCVCVCVCVCKRDCMMQSFMCDTNFWLASFSSCVLFFKIQLQPKNECVYDGVNE